MRYNLAHKFTSDDKISYMNIRRDESGFEGGTRVVRTEVCSESMARRVAAMMDLDPDSMVEGLPLPRGWQFILMGADTRRTSLRVDGFPGLGVPMPDIGLPRLLLGGRKVSYLQDIPIGSRLMRTSSIESLKRKTTNSGPMGVVTIAHELRLEEQSVLALVETQTYLLLPMRNGSMIENVSRRPSEIVSAHVKTVVPDETLLFQFSALGFNSHKIHTNRSYACDVEGFPDLVVNGGLATLMLTEFLRRDLGVSPTAINVRHIAPIYCDRPLTMTADQEGAVWKLKAYDHKNSLAIEMELENQ
jgi:3-methylfumaryl-CoA hydratase